MKFNDKLITCNRSIRCGMSVYCAEGDVLSIAFMFSRSD